MLLTETLARPLGEALADRASYWIGEIAEMLQEGDPAVFDYEPRKRIEEIEHEPRSGFWPWTSGGYEVCLPASLAHCWSRGYAPAPIASTIASGNSIIADCWADQYPERPGLVDCICADDGTEAAQWREEAADFELGGWMSDDACYYWKARVIFYAPGDRDNKSGKPEVYLDCYLCADSYGRDDIGWLSCYGQKTDQTHGRFKLQMDAERFARLTDAQLDRMAKVALRRLPSFVGV